MWVKWDECQYWLDWQPLASKVQNIRMILDKNVPKDCFYVHTGSDLFVAHHYEATSWSFAGITPVYYTRILHLWCSGQVISLVVHVFMSVLIFPSCYSHSSVQPWYLSSTYTCLLPHSHTFTVSLEGAILCFVSHHFSSKLTVGHNR